MDKKVFSQEESELVWGRTGGLCLYCGVQMTRKVSSNEIIKVRFTIDHLIPVSSGGTHDLDNLVPACYACNHDKSNLTLDQFREKIGYRKKGWPKFTPAQRRFLAERDLSLPLSEHKFFFETNTEFMLGSDRGQDTKPVVG